MVDCPVLRTVCGGAALTAVAEALDAAWSACSWVPEPIRRQVRIAVDEIAANIVEHAARGRAVPMEMQLQVLPDRVQILFTDQGDPAPVDIDRAEMPDELAERGRGLAMAKAALAQLDYCHSGDCNQWTLVSHAFDDCA